METEKKKAPGRPKKDGPLKTAVSFRLSVAAKKSMVALARETGLSQASVIELALRDFAKKRGVPVDAD